MITESTIGELVEALIDYRGKTPVKSDAGVPLITAKVIKGGTILTGQREYIAEASYDSWMRRGLPKSGDILITTEAPLGEVARVGPDARIALAQRVILLRPNAARVDPSFFFHYLRSEQAQASLRRRASGTTVSGIRQPELKAVEIRLPPRQAQKSIGAVLDAMDELIENNRRRVQIVEEMARGIYREWFVKFRYPGHEDVPLVGSSLGRIPDGWAFKNLGDAIQLKYGKALKADARVAGDVSVVGSSGVVGWHNFPLISGPAIVVGRKGNVGSVIWLDGPSWPIDTTYYVETELPLRFVVEQLRSIGFTNSHSAVPGLSREAAYALPFLIPPPNLLGSFQALVDPSGLLATRLQQQAAKLGDLRDLLLPKLVTGQIEVSNLNLDALLEGAVA